MKPLAFALEFRGEAVQLEPGRYWVETHASGGIQGLGGDEATCRRSFELTADGSLVDRGELIFGDGDGLTFSARGRLRRSPDPRYRHGTSILEVTGGRGRLAGASGFLTSNFLLADTGELTDHHNGLVFIGATEERKQ